MTSSADEIIISDLQQILPLLTLSDARKLVDFFNAKIARMKAQMELIEEVFIDHRGTKE